MESIHANERNATGKKGGQIFNAKGIKLPNTVSWQIQEYHGRFTCVVYLHVI